MSDNKKVSIFMGGTGANNASDALTNLGAAPAAAYAQANTARGTANDAYAQANTARSTANDAYAAANSAANTVRVSQNGASTLSAKQLNFVNTANVKIAVTDSGDGNANITFELGSGGGTLSNIAISSNSVFATNANAFNFINTSSVQVTVAPGINGNANISFTSSGGGGGGTVVVRDNFTGDGNTTNFTMSTEAEDENHVLVFVDLVFQSENAYSVSGDTLAFATAPDDGSAIDVYIYGGGVGSTVVTSDVFTGTGSCTSFTLTQTGSTSRTFVYIDGVSQRPQYDYQVSGTALSLNVAPASASVIEVRTLSAFNTVDIDVAPVSITSDTFTGTGSCTQFTMSQSGTTDSTFVFLNGVSQKPGTNYTIGGPGNNVITMAAAPSNGSVLEVRSMGAFKIVENQSRIDSDVFTGDGNTTIFTLSTSTISKKALVFIDGVAQKPGTDYNVGGNKITFVEAPPDGSSIEVRSISPFIFASSSAELAYDQANLALSTATSASSSVGAAYNQANAAYAQANTVYGQANAAYGQANSAFAAANNRVLKTGDTITGTLAIQQTQEKINVTATALGANLTVDILDGAVTYLTTNATANSTLNIRGNSTVLLDTVMSTGQSMTTVVMVTNGSTGFRIANVQIDGTSVTPRWAANTVPTANTNSIDVYAFTMIKTASNTYTVLGSKTQFAS
jgi:hypothetical protein